MRNLLFTLIGLFTIGTASAQNYTTVFEQGNVEVWLNKDQTNLYLDVKGDVATFVVFKGKDESFGTFLVLPKNVVGVKTVYVTGNNGQTFVKESITFNEGFAGIDGLLEKLTNSGVKLINSSEVWFAVDGVVYKIDLTNLRDGMKAFIEFDFNAIGGNPFTPNSDNPFQG